MSSILSNISGIYPGYILLRIFVSLFAAKPYGVVDWQEIVLKIVDMDAKKMAEQIDSVIQQLLGIQAALRSSLPQPAPSLEWEAENKICHYCKEPLGEEKPSRGDHGRCYKEIMRQIQKGEITEEIAIQNGWFAPVKKAGRKPKESPITQFASDQLAKSMAEKLNLPQKAAEKKSSYRPN